ncbi:type II toxin-antitoxin system RelE/ParE family toxin [Mucilaginibacter arboris]|uniref:Type II toxin-antitoxin system RelE/ParE family toxin n=1 Tax=Mucilaginibacter arboris TaxID=2682090 RepID=A0A7K1SUK4_9SPHI|nr:type II toxin-antitoxin system RelE/ParE family toxin [Mucilaginibacter arboris]MVN20974.1 hypothetical protein [Mucilaginibacter arboris]
MKIILTKRAEQNFISIKEYIQQNFGEIVAEVFEQKITDFLHLLKTYPQIGSVEVKSKQIRAFRLTKLTTVFYRIKDQNMIILTFFDVRQDPKKKPK